jgi:hypothetical protein
MYNKIVKCVKMPSFNAAKCARGEAAYCEKCYVQKKLKCHAIVPRGSGNEKGFTGSNYYKLQRDECKKVVDPCSTAARYL